MTEPGFLGDVTFGKGLVQTIFPLNDNTGLALTTQHYYTPSGRLIQRELFATFRFWITITAGEQMRRTRQTSSKPT